MQVTVQYFEGSAYVGSEILERLWLSSDQIATSYWWPNTAYWCGHCGEIWGWAITQATVSLPQTWAIRHRRCAKHGDGEFLSWSDLEAADPDLLRREFLLTLWSNRYD